MEKRKGTTMTTYVKDKKVQARREVILKVLRKQKNTFFKSSEIQQLVPDFDIVQVGNDLLHLAAHQQIVKMPVCKKFAGTVKFKYGVGTYTFKSGEMSLQERDMILVNIKNFFLESLETCDAVHIKSVPFQYRLSNHIIVKYLHTLEEDGILSVNKKPGKKGTFVSKPKVLGEVLKQPESTVVSEFTEAINTINAAVQTLIAENESLKNSSNKVPFEVAAFKAQVNRVLKEFISKPALERRDLISKAPNTNDFLTYLWENL
jgi:hypothetical protein